MILVSACLWGEPTRYDGRPRPCEELQKHLQGQALLLLCPEVMGGLGVPREPVGFTPAMHGQEGRWVLEGRAQLLDSQGRDYSAAFISGANKVLELALSHGVERAYLKDRSPSCAYDPQRLNPKGGPGLGVLSALLLAHGVAVREVRG